MAEFPWEMSVKIGRPDGWWNRKVPIGQISLMTGALLFGLILWLIYGDFIGSVLWGIRHQRTANFRGQTLQVPWFWREKEWTNYNEFELARIYREPRLNSLVTVRYENSSPENVPKQVERMRETNARLSSVPGYFSGDYEGNDFSTAHYVCLNLGYKWSPILIVDCLSKDGRWNVSMFGMQQSRSEFEMILRGVASMGNPSK